MFSLFGSSNYGFFFIFFELTLIIESKDNKRFEFNWNADQLNYAVLNYKVNRIEKLISNSSKAYLSLKIKWS